MNQLKKLFPFIREREEMLSEINQNSNLSTIFYTWSLEERERFLDICTGAKGFKILQDPIFKEELLLKQHCSSPISSWSSPTKVLLT